MVTTSTPPLTAFKAGRPFTPMIRSFMASAVGLGPVFSASNPLKQNSSAATVFFGFLNPMSAKDMHQVMVQTLGSDTTAADALNGLCGMLIISAHKLAKSCIDRSPEFEVFEHLRTAATRGNKFHFKSDEPKYPAKWRTFQIDESRKGTLNPLHGKPCFGTVFGPADVLLFLSDIDKKMA
jgi:hypothetical protein